jgi:hypothetical protein
MSPTDEDLWATYAAAAIMAGHRTPDAIDQIASDAVALHRRRFATEPATPTSHSLPPPMPSTSEKPSKGKDYR